MYHSDRIKLFNGAKNHKDIASLISQADCGIYPSRAEGWNLELLETMAMNKPTIATNYSAHTEFCTKDNCFLVDITETEKAFDGKAFKNQGNWAKIGQTQIDDIISHMRYVYQNRINTNPSGLRTAELFSWDNTARAIQRCI
jgi:glycosyltransferase involved in cell wall biosynthesis